MKDKIKVMIVDDDKFICSSLATILEANEDIEVIATAYSGSEAIETYKASLPHILLMDIRMGDVSGIQSGEAILSLYPKAKIIFLTTFADDEYIVKALNMGAKGSYSAGNLLLSEKIRILIMKIKNNIEMENSIKIENNIKDVALIFEGGGMRASYTAGFLNTLLEKEVYFDYVAGISAGASHSVNYLSRDIERAEESFVDLVLDPNFGDWKSFLKGEGLFRAKYIYEETGHSSGVLPFNFKAFRGNPARLRIGSFNCEKGEVVYFKEKDTTTLEKLMKIVRASSSMPIFMPPTEIDGVVYVDGGIGGGIPLDIAEKEGMEKFFVILTRPRGYRKEPVKFGKALRLYYKKYPKVAEAMLSRHLVYNKTLDKLEALERQGKAFLVYPEIMPVSSRETDFIKLRESYALGYAQGQRDFPKWKEFLEV